MIENMLHKHRYFGHSREIHESCPWSVTTVTPMKRGLKDNRRAINLHGWVGYNRYPDEKGTELADPNCVTATLVTTVTPMKRGLKGRI